VTVLGHPVPVRSVLCDLKIQARTLKRDIHVTYLAAHSPRLPWLANCAANPSLSLEPCIHMLGVHNARLRYFGGDPILVSVRQSAVLFEKEN
jgi:hypothetical protein